MKEQMATHAYGAKRKDKTIYITDEDAASEPVQQNRQPRPGDTICISDAEFYAERSRSSVVRRGTIPPTSAQNRTMLRVTRHTVPPVTPRASLKAQQPQPQPQPQQQVKPKPGKQKSTSFRPHWLLGVGVGMVGMLTLWTAGTGILSWLQTQHDTSIYGYPRHYEIDANVDHAGVSHFIVENLHGDILVIEVHPSNLAETRIYQGPQFSGVGADDYIATVSFKDLGNGKPDMIIAVNDQRFVLVNDGTGFRPVEASDHINQQEVN